MKRVGAFAFFLLFLAGIAIVNLRNMADRTADSIVVPQYVDLHGDAWKLLRLVGAQPSPDAGYALSFAANATLSLRGACNRFNGDYAVESGSLRIGDLAGTRRACEPDIMQADQLVLQALAAARRLTLAGNRLLMYGHEDQLLAVFYREQIRRTTDEDSIE